MACFAAHLPSVRIPSLLCCRKLMVPLLRLQALPQALWYGLAANSTAPSVELGGVPLRLAAECENYTLGVVRLQVCTGRPLRQMAGRPHCTGEVGFVFSVVSFRQLMHSRWGRQVGAWASALAPGVERGVASYV